eukprot:TRINITY_DN735_c0_g1_i1.p1 TRINITY_DN735_c0_g1~~TRINITY_DN735_c0_g1_i1.p1  ORF type:complete len:632 (-),score=100.28 TRINITY_DN735_c0_g1_i1:79-1974(-)
MGNDPSRPGPRRAHGHPIHGSQQLLQPPLQTVPKTPAERLANVEQLVFEEIEMPEMGSVLGYGASAKVVKGIWKKTPVAVKRFFDLVNPDEFVNEVLTQSSLRHQNIAPFIGFTLQPMCIVTQYYSKGSLYDILHVKQPPTYLPKLVITKILKDIARGMIYLHSKGLVHRDLKPGNLLINSLSLDDIVSCVITDFGITREQSPLMTAGMGTPVYSAPEVFMGKRELHYSKQVDIFSFAIIMWECWSRQIPFRDILEPVVDVIGRGERPPVPSDWLPEYVQLMSQCWEQDPLKRPPFEVVLQKLEELEPKIPAEPMIEHHRSDSIGDIHMHPQPHTLTGSFITTGPHTTVTHSNSGIELSGARRTASMFGAIPGAENIALAGSNSGGSIGSSGTLTPMALSTSGSGLGSSGSRQLSDLVSEDAKIIPGEKIDWDSFLNAIQERYSASEKDVLQLKPLIEESPNVVSKKKFMEILKWFSPLIPEPYSVYQTAYQVESTLYQAATPEPPPPTPNESGYPVSEIAAILSEEWFHGFISSGEATARLSQYTAGAFLLRFSSSKPGAYALSLQNGNRDAKTVIHWLINNEPNKKFKIFQRVYDGLHDIVKVHSQEPLKLQDGRNSCPFTHACPKSRT